TLAAPGSSSTLPTAYAAAPPLGAIRSKVAGSCLSFPRVAAALSSRRRPEEQPRRMGIPDQPRMPPAAGGCHRRHSGNAPIDPIVWAGRNPRPVVQSVIHAKNYSPVCHDWVLFIREHAMGQLSSIDNHVGGANVSSVYVPPLQRTQGQPPPIAANGGLSYMSFDRDGDAGTAAATTAALRLLAEGKGQVATDLLDKAPPGPVETKWGVGFRSYDECLEYIRAKNIVAPEGGVAVPLRYTVFEQPSYSMVPSNALWRDPARADLAKALRKEEQDVVRRCLYFPQVLRDARRMQQYYPGLSPNSPECMDKLGVALAHCE